MVQILASIYSTPMGSNAANLYVRLERECASQIFPIWRHGIGNPVRGAGLYIGTKAKADAYYFLLPDEGTGYHFSEGTYKLEIFIEKDGKRPKMTFSEVLTVSHEQAQQMKRRRMGIDFIWMPSEKKYMGKVGNR
jgi:hypothetical protein